MFFKNIGHADILLERAVSAKDRAVGVGAAPRFSGAPQDSGQIVLRPNDVLDLPEFYLRTWRLMRELTVKVKNTSGANVNYLGDVYANSDEFFVSYGNNGKGARATVNGAVVMIQSAVDNADLSYIHTLNDDKWGGPNALATGRSNIVTVTNITRVRVLVQATDTTATPAIYAPGSEGLVLSEKIFVTGSAVGAQAKTTFSYYQDATYPTQVTKVVEIEQTVTAGDIAAP